MTMRTIGTDMEIFAVDNQGIHRSLCGKIGGTKEQPLQVGHLPSGFCVQEDNVSLEFNIPACDNRQDFISSVQIMMKYNADLLKKYGFTISQDSSATFIADELTHPNALVFGCEPDYNAWTQAENPKPIAVNKQLRTAGGHIHVGTAVDIVHATKCMDLYLGVPSIILDDTDSSRKRRELYGKAGALRPKPYGFEYRTLSNFWTFKEELINWVYSQTKLAMNHGKAMTAKDAKTIQHIINTGDKDAARAIINSYGLAIPQLS